MASVGLMYNHRTSKKYNCRRPNSGATSSGENTRRNSLGEFSCTDTLVPDSPSGVSKDLSSGQDPSDNGQLEKISRQDERNGNWSPGKRNDHIHSSSNGRWTKQTSKTDQVIQRVNSVAGLGLPFEVDHRVPIPLR